MPIRSMTGYVSAQKGLSLGLCNIEIKSVNSRYLEIIIKAPEKLRFLESQFRELIQKYITRGKVEVRLGLIETSDDALTVSETALGRYLSLQENILKANPSAAPLSVSEILALDGILLQKRLDEESVKADFLNFFESALQQFNATREREGLALKGVVLEYLDELKALVQNIEPKIPLIIQDIETKLQERLQKAFENVSSTIPKEELNARISQEITLYALKLDVAEEISRLYTHIAETKRILETETTVGKKLDFMIQEMNRESNTLGSKSANIESTDTAIGLKVVLEKIREQIQNLE